MYPHFEDVSGIDGIYIMPAIACYVLRQNVTTEASHHHCVILEKFAPKENEVEARQAAQTCLQEPETLRQLLAAIADKITDFKE
jgi:hypothetical protein